MNARAGVEKNVIGGRLVGEAVGQNKRTRDAYAGYDAIINVTDDVNHHWKRVLFCQNDATHVSHATTYINCYF